MHRFFHRKTKIYFYKPTRETTLTQSLSRTLLFICLFFPLSVGKVMSTHTHTHYYIMVANAKDCVIPLRNIFERKVHSLNYFANH